MPLKHLRCLILFSASIDSTAVRTRVVHLNFVAFLVKYVISSSVLDKAEYLIVASLLLQCGIRLFIIRLYKKFQQLGDLSETFLHNKTNSMNLAP